MAPGVPDLTAFLTFRVGRRTVNCTPSIGDTGTGAWIVTGV